MKARLTILASDILTVGYVNGMDCPITRALRRAGFQGIHDAGTAIRTDFDKRKPYGNRDVISIDTDPVYAELAERVVSMYRPLEDESHEDPVDFSMCLEIPDEFYVGTKQEEEPCV